jgi:hypothetical protein
MTTAAAEILVRIAPEHIQTLTSSELIDTVASIWSDVEMADLLAGSEEFFWERLLHWAERGHLTAQEDQGTRRLLALAYRPRLLARVNGERAVEIGGD